MLYLFRDIMRGGFRCPLGFNRDRETTAAHRQQLHELKMEVFNIVPTICSPSDLAGFQVLARTPALRSALRSAHLGQYVHERIIFHRRSENRREALRLTARDVINYYFRG